LEIQTLQSSVETRLSDLENLISDARDDANDDVIGHHILSVLPKRDSTEKTLKLFSNDATIGIGKVRRCSE
jgi:hypothetical protein